MQSKSSRPMYICLALMCMGVIIFSARWAQKMASVDAETAHQNQNERLSEAQKTKEPVFEKYFSRPCAGKLLIPFDLENPVFHPQTGIWRIHTAVDFHCTKEDPVHAPCSGRISNAQNGEITIEKDEHRLFLRGLLNISVQTGEYVFEGQIIGTGGGFVPLEGQNLLCVQVQNKKGENIDFSLFMDQKNLPE